MRLDTSLLPADPRLIVVAAFSGGPDSTALLHFLHSSGYRVHAAHVHHHLRGGEADADAAYCAEFCRERGIPFTLLSVDVAGEREAAGGGIQEVARRLRYAALERCAGQTPASAIATAHNRDDNAETILLNIIRGTGTNGLRGIPAKRGRIVRPLLDTPRAEIEAYCEEHGLTPRRDSSNDSTKYARNEVRHTLMPYLRERFNPHVEDALTRLAEIASEESRLLDALAARWLDPAAAIDAPMLAAEPVALQRRVIRHFLRVVANLEDLSFEHVEDLRINLGRRFQTMLPRSVVIRGSERWVERVPAGEFARNDAPAIVSISVPGSADYFGWRVTASGEIAGPSALLVVRSWLPGDRMRFHYGRKKLKALFQQARTPVQLRWTLPLLVDPATDEVVAVANGLVSDFHPGLRFNAERIEKPIAG